MSANSNSNRPTTSANSMLAGGHQQRSPLAATNRLARGRAHSQSADILTSQLAHIVGSELSLCARDNEDSLASALAAVAHRGNAEQTISARIIDVKRRKPRREAQLQDNHQDADDDDDDEQRPPGNNSNGRWLLFGPAAEQRVATTELWDANVQRSGQQASGAAARAHQYRASGHQQQQQQQAQQARQSEASARRQASNQKQQSGETLSSVESDYDLLIYLGETETEDLVDTERSLDYQDQTWRQSICGGASLAPTIDESLSELLSLGGGGGGGQDGASPAGGASPRRVATAASERRDEQDDDLEHLLLLNSAGSLTRLPLAQQQQLQNRLQARQRPPPPVTNYRLASASLPRQQVDKTAVREKVTTNTTTFKSNTNTSKRHEEEEGQIAGEHQQVARALGQLCASQEHVRQQQQQQAYERNLSNARSKQRAQPRSPSYENARTTARKAPNAADDELERLLAEMSDSLDLNSLARYDTRPETGARGHKASVSSLLDEYDGASRMLEQMISEQLLETTRATSSSGPKLSAPKPRANEAVAAATTSRKVSTCSSSVASVVPNVAKSVQVDCASLAQRPSQLVAPISLQKQPGHINEQKVEVAHEANERATFGLIPSTERRHSTSSSSSSEASSLPPKPPAKDYADELIVSAPLSFQEGRQQRVIQVEPAELPSSGDESQPVQPTRMARRLKLGMQSVRAKLRAAASRAGPQIPGARTGSQAPVAVGERATSLEQPKSTEAAAKDQERRSRCKTRATASNGAHPEEVSTNTKSFGQQWRERLNRSKSRLGHWLPLGRTSGGAFKRAKSEPNAAKRRNQAELTKEADDQLLQFQPGDIARNSSQGQQRRLSSDSGELSGLERGSGGLGCQRRTRGRAAETSSRRSSLVRPLQLVGEPPIRPSRQQATDKADKRRWLAAKRRRNKSAPLELVAPTGGVAAQSRKRTSDDYFGLVSAPIRPPSDELAASLLVTARNTSATNGPPLCSNQSVRVEMGPEVSVAARLRQPRSQSMRSIGAAMRRSLTTVATSAANKQRHLDEANKFPQEQEPQRAVSFSNLNSHGNNGCRRRPLSPIEPNTFRPASALANSQTVATTTGAHGLSVEPVQLAKPVAPISLAKAAGEHQFVARLEKPESSQSSSKASRSPMRARGAAIIGDLRAKCNQLLLRASPPAASQAKASHEAPERPPRRQKRNCEQHCERRSKSLARAANLTQGAAQGPNKLVLLASQLRSSAGELLHSGGASSLRATNKQANIDRAQQPIFKPQSMEEPMDEQQQQQRQLCQWRPVLTTTSNSKQHSGGVATHLLRSASFRAIEAAKIVPLSVKDEQPLEQPAENESKTTLEHTSKQRSLDEDSSWESSSSTGSSSSASLALNEKRASGTTVNMTRVVPDTRADESLALKCAELVALQAQGESQQQEAPHIALNNKAQQRDTSETNSNSGKTTCGSGGKSSSDSTGTGERARDAQKKTSSLSRSLGSEWLQASGQAFGQQQNTNNRAIGTNEIIIISKLENIDSKQQEEANKATKLLEGDAIMRLEPAASSKAQAGSSVNLSEQQQQQQQQQREQECQRILKNNKKLDIDNDQCRPSSDNVSKPEGLFKFSSDLPSPGQLFDERRRAFELGLEKKLGRVASEVLGQQDDEQDSVWPQQDDQEEASVAQNRLSVYENAPMLVSNPNCLVNKKQEEKIASEDSKRRRPPIAPKPKLVAMTSIIQEPEDELMNVSEQKFAKQKFGEQQAAEQPFKGSAFSLCFKTGSAISLNNSDSDNSSVAPVAGRRRLERKFEQLAAGSQAKQLALAASKPPAPQIPRANASGSLVKRLARNFDRPAAQEAQCGKQGSQRPPVAVVTTSKLMRQNSQQAGGALSDEPKSDSTWYDAKSIEMLDEAELAELLREFGDSPAASQHALAEQIDSAEHQNDDTTDEEATLNEEEFEAPADGNDDDDDDLLDDEVSLTYASAATNLAAADSSPPPQETKAAAAAAASTQGSISESRGETLTSLSSLAADSGAKAAEVPPLFSCVSHERSPNERGAAAVHNSPSEQRARAKQQQQHCLSAASDASEQTLPTTTTLINTNDENQHKHDNIRQQKHTSNKILIDTKFKNNLEKIINSNNNNNHNNTTAAKSTNDTLADQQQRRPMTQQQQSPPPPPPQAGNTGQPDEPKRQRRSKRTRQQAVATRELARYCRFVANMTRSNNDTNNSKKQTLSKKKALLEDYIHSSSDEQESSDDEDDEEDEFSSVCSTNEISQEKKDKCLTDDKAKGSNDNNKNKLEHLGTKNLLKAAKKCSKLYDELERLLARRVQEEKQSKQTISITKKTNTDTWQQKDLKESTESISSLSTTNLSLRPSSSTAQLHSEDRISLSSSSVSSESMPEIKQRQNLQKLYNIVNEIYTSEAKFVDTLRLLNVDFRQHINASLTTQTMINNNNTSEMISALNQPPFDCIQKMLKHLPQLQALNENLLDELKRARDEWPKTQKISHILVKIGPFLKHYSSYIRDFELIQAQLQENLKKYAQFSEIIKSFESSERCQKLTIQHHLLKPIQRIPQYRLLLQQYLHHLKPDDQDYEDTVSALEVVSRVAEHANESMNDGINFAKLLALQAKIVGKQRDIIQPGRVFLKEGELIKVSRKQRHPRWFILLNDALLYLTQIQSSDIMYLKYELELNANCQVQTPSERVSHNLIGQQFETEFNVCTPVRSFTLVAKSRQERDEWVSLLRQAIGDYVAKQRSFNNNNNNNNNNKSSNSLSSSEISKAPYGEQQSQFSIDNVQQLNTGNSSQEKLLGSQAPLWTPDSRVTMCQLCTSNFSALFRRHHCRACGRVVCSACSSNKAPLVYLKCRSARVCDQCFESLKSNLHLYYLPSSQCQLAGQINERELKLLDEHFKTLLKTQFLKHTGFERIKQAAGKGIQLQQSSSSSSSLSTMNSSAIDLSERPRGLRQLSSIISGNSASGPLICGHLHKRHNKKPKWKRQWFVIRNNVLEAYRAIDDVAAVDSLALVGFLADQPSEQIDGLDASCLIRLRHPSLSDNNSRRPLAEQQHHKGGKNFNCFLEHLFRAEDREAAARWLEAFRRSVVISPSENLAKTSSLVSNKSASLIQ